MNLFSGNGLILAGVLLIVGGFCYKLGLLSWFGQLPGDLRIERGNTRVFIPLTSMLLVSIGVSLLLSFLRRF